MELEARLRAFAAFARHRSFSAAAQELRISQPAVSKHVADVEREVGARLVDRHSRGGTLTSAGECLGQSRAPGASAAGPGRAGRGGVP